MIHVAIVVIHIITTIATCIAYKWYIMSFKLITNMNNIMCILCIKLMYISYDIGLFNYIITHI